MLAITGGKGGTGKTTTTLALARALAATGTAVTCVDADWDLPDLGALAGGPRRCSAAADTGPPHEATFTAPDADGVEILPAPADPMARDPERRLRAVAGGVDRETVVLCPAGTAPDAVAPLRVATAAILVTEPCAASLRDAARTAAMARAVGTRVAGAVVTNARFVPDGVEAVLGCQVLACVPYADSPLDSETTAAAYRDVATAVRRPDEKIHH
ncbi:MinD/ParA family ATP-binding protein [Halobaculum limi]|uniref:MinD/ParA family ATP-binding protein n=1 Tax=Halobaculum limi TaxID=3031916 RepID=UPI002404FB85|nr:P-loop NTPase [Halobaculum sp. YSMS11]